MASSTSFNDHVHHREDPCSKKEDPCKIQGLEKYGVLKCKVKDTGLCHGENHHYQVHTVANGIDYRLAINIKSEDSATSSNKNSNHDNTELRYCIMENFNHDILSKISTLSEGYTALKSVEGQDYALDYVRGGLVKESDFTILPNDDSNHNKFKEKIATHFDNVITKDAFVYAFGSRWGPEQNCKDKCFDFIPGNGIHDIHMNQGNNEDHMCDDGVWQDGGVLIHYPSEDTWTAIFLAFQSQSFQTDNQTGHRLNPPSN
ncbi:YukJ family protein [Bacillus cereus]|nr:YukJ family protein [Bacillus cereus]MDA2169397.1 YukJ family protein [Bacillus cereus]